MSIEIAKARIAAAKTQQLKRLDLGRCGLTYLETEVPELFDLVHLEELYLSSRWYDYTQGEWIDSQNKGEKNQLAKLPKKIAKLTQLKVLILGGDYFHEWEIKDISALAGLTNLQWLSLRYTKIQEISALKGLENLEILDLSGTLITNINALSNLKKLQFLDIQSTSINQIKVLRELNNLEVLYLSNIKISDISALENLTKLRELYLGLTKIKEISSLANLLHLEVLYLYNTQISNISALAGLTNLQKLDISNTQVTDISPLLPLLKREENPLKCVLKDSFLAEKGEINLTGCPLIHPPIETVAKGNAAILAYFEELEKTGMEKVREAKLILTGSGESGKTSLRLRLKDRKAKLPTKDERTRNVEVEEYEFLARDGATFQAHIWDFGGQQILHHFHRFFMNADALYVLMTETSRQHDNLEYWLQNIRLFGKQSPILFVQNKRNGIPRSLSIAPYKQHFAIREELLEVNLLTNEGLDALEQAIQYHIQTLPITQREIPKSWFRVREALEAERKKTPVLLYATFVEYCAAQGITKREGIEAVGTFLHALGTILWYHENDTLRGKIILQRHWATEGIFELVFHEQIQQTARFDKALAQDIWDNCPKSQDYAHHCADLIAMMYEFRICYPQKGKKNAYIIPALLPATPVELLQLYEPRLQVTYRYAFMPQGISNYLAAEMNQYIENDAHVWSEGFYLHKEKAQAKITENKYANTLEIVLSGAEHQVWFGAIKNIIEEMHNDYAGISPVLEIPCICEVCKQGLLKDRKTFEYAEVIERKNSGVKKTIECRKSGADVSVQALLDNLLPTELQEKHLPTKRQEKTVLEWVAADKLEYALDLLRQEESVVLLKRELKECEEGYTKGIINAAAYSEQKTKISNRILRLAESQQAAMSLPINAEIAENRNLPAEEKSVAEVPFYKKWWAKWLAVMGGIGVVLTFTAGLFGTLNDGVSFWDRMMKTDSDKKENPLPKEIKADTSKAKKLAKDSTHRKKK